MFTRLFKFYIIFVLVTPSIINCFKALKKSIETGDFEVNFQIFCIFYFIIASIFLLKIIADIDFSKINDFEKYSYKIEIKLGDGYFYKYLFIFFMIIASIFSSIIDKYFGFPREYDFSFRNMILLLTVAFAIYYEPSRLKE